MKKITDTEIAEKLEKTLDLYSDDVKKYVKNDKKRTPKKITKQRLQNIGLSYIERFGGTEKSLRDVLNKRIKKSLAELPDQDDTYFATWVDEIVSKVKEYGYINDEIYAKQRAKMLSAKGNSKRMIIAKLKQKGINDFDIENSFVEFDNNSELLSAIKYAQKRKFGVFANDGGLDTSNRQKQLASLARNGFSYEISQKALRGIIEE